MRLFGRVVAYKYVVATVFVSALFLDLLDITIVNVALRTIGEEFETEAIEWVVLGYTLSLAVWIPASGWMGDRFGTKRIFLASMFLFVGGSMLCGLSQTIGQLIAFRVLQGVGGGMLTPIGVAMLFRAFPPIERARASTIVMIPTLVAPALGPVLGGLLTDTLGWRWIFFVNLPFGARRWSSASASSASTPSRRRDRSTSLASCCRGSRWHRSPTRSARGRESAGRARGGRPRRRRRPRLRPPRLRRDPCPAPDAGAAAAAPAAVPGHQPGDGVGHGQLHRADVRAAAVPPGPARAEPAGERADDVPPGDRHPHRLADLRPHLPRRRSPPADRRRHARRRRQRCRCCCSSTSTPTCGGSAP